MKVHLVGAGGIGMSAVAQLLLAQGADVTGSDAADSPLLRKIRGRGARTFVGHAAGNLNHPDLVVYSSSIAPQNPELVLARNRGIPVLHRGQILAELVASRRTIAVAGAHGKSTTAALTAQLLTAAGLDPTAVLGAEVKQLGGNARLGRGPYAVVEADESDGSFLWLRPHVAVITNLDDEHLDYFRNRFEIRQAYLSFAERVSSKGAVVGCADDPSVRWVLRAAGRRQLTYGLSARAEIRAEEVQLRGPESRYRCTRSGRTLGQVVLRVPGVHNVVNSLAVVAVSQLLGLEFGAVTSTLAEYQGARRRFQIHGEVRRVLVVEDYAHHPTEIAATLRAARSWPGRRIRCVFQPHRYTRTRYLMNRFGSAFSDADEVILLPVYSASERPIEGASAEAMQQAISNRSRRNVGVRPAEEALAFLQESARPGDMILFLGAGSVGMLASRLVRIL